MREIRKREEDTIYERLHLAGAVSVVHDGVEWIRLEEAGKTIIDWYCDYAKSGADDILYAIAKRHHFYLREKPAMKAEARRVEIPSHEQEEIRLLVIRSECDAMVAQAINEWIEWAMKEEEEWKKGRGKKYDVFFQKVTTPIAPDDEDYYMRVVLSKDKDICLFNDFMTPVPYALKKEEEEKRKKRAYKELKKRLVAICAIYGIPERMMDFPVV
jgi:hypothetical protein